MSDARIRSTQTLLDGKPLPRGCAVELVGSREFLGPSREFVTTRYQAWLTQLISGTSVRVRRLEPQPITVAIEYEDGTRERINVLADAIS